jgi:hypothetical protein
MKMGGRCPLNKVRNQEKFLRTEIERFYNRPMKASSIELMKEKFCRDICKNILC